MIAIVKECFFNKDQRFDIGDTIDTKSMPKSVYLGKIEPIEDVKAPKTNENKDGGTITPKTEKTKQEVTQKNKMVTDSVNK